MNNGLTSCNESSTTGGLETKPGDTGLRGCSCYCWLATVFIVAEDISGARPISYAVQVTIRSSSDPGTVITLPSALGSLSITVGGDVAWTSLGTCTLPPTGGSDPGLTWHAFYSAKNNPDSAASIVSSAGEGGKCCKYCWADEYAVTTAVAPNNTVDTYPFEDPNYLVPLNPGPIKWRDALALANAALTNPSPGFQGTTGHINTIGLGNGIGLGVQCYPVDVDTGGLVGQYVVCDSPGGGTVVEACPSSFSCKLNAAGQTPGAEGISPPFPSDNCEDPVGLGVARVRYRSFNYALFDMPSIITTDDVFDVGVKFKNPFTGNMVDGSNHFTDDQDVDIDTIPAIELESLMDPGEEIVVGSIPRAGFNDYTLTSVQVLAKAPSVRRANVYPYQVGPGGGCGFPISGVGWPSHPRVASKPFKLRPGVAKYIDFEQNIDFPCYPSFGTTLFVQIAAPIKLFDVNGNPTRNLRGRLLDVVGQNQLYNVAPSATDLVTMTLYPDTVGFGPNSNGFNDGNEVLYGTTARNAVRGIATFDDLSAKALGYNYLLKVTASGITPSSNAWTNVYPGPLAGNDVWFWVDQVIDPTTIGPFVHGVTYTIKIALKDALGNTVIPDNPDDITLQDGGSGFTGAGTVTPVLGVASFTGSFPNPGTWTLGYFTSFNTYPGRMFFDPIPPVFPACNTDFPTIPQVITVT